MKEYWSSIGVETSIPWPTKEVKVSFEGHTLVLRPESESNSPSIAFEHGSKNISTDDAMVIVRRFLSALSWVEGYGIRETFWIGSERPVGIGKGPKWSVQTTHFDPIYLPAPTDPKQKLALALYRNALSTNTGPYKFLGFVRILNIVAKTKTDHKNWINTHLSLVKDNDALKIIKGLQNQGLDIGEHLYVSGRCAVAHANEGTIVDPDSSTDLKRINDELPLAKALAQIVIEKELGIKSRNTVWNEHLYELSGFKKRIPEKMINEVTIGTKRRVDPNEIGFNISVGLRQKISYEGMENLLVVDAEMHDGILELLLRSDDESIQFWIGLNFKEESLIYDPYDGMMFHDDGTKKSIEKILSFWKFKKDLFLNGALQLTVPSSEEILGFTDAFIPSNIDLGGTIKNFDQVIAHLEQEVKKRT